MGGSRHEGKGGPQSHHEILHAAGKVALVPGGPCWRQGSAVLGSQCCRCQGHGLEAAGAHGPCTRALHRSAHVRLGRSQTAWCSGCIHLPAACPCDARHGMALQAGHLAALEQSSCAAGGASWPPRCAAGLLHHCCWEHGSRRLPALLCGWLSASLCRWTEAIVGHVC